MIEKTGHKVIIRNERLKWIEEGKPRSQAYGEDEFREGQTDPAKQPTRIAPIFESARQAREMTPAIDDLFGDDDIYNATPRARRKAVQPADDTPDDDELMALMAEQEAAAAPTFGSIFGGGASQKLSQPSRIPDDDDLDALMAEAEAQTVSQPPARTSIFGGGGSTPKTAPPVNEEYDDDLFNCHCSGQSARRDAADAFPGMGWPGSQSSRRASVSSAQSLYPLRGRRRECDAHRARGHDRR